MALSINSNIASLNAQRNLTRSQETLNTSLQRLSTGLRINSAKDDAAGLAISTRFTTQINGLNQAVRNANDGISLAQTGEAALDEITNNLQRIRELAVQSANATNTADDRASLDLEVQQRLSEISRIGSQTTFNGQRILDGSFGTAAFQVGANVGETINVALSTGVKASQIGQIATATGGNTTNADVTEGNLTIQIGSATAVAVGNSTAGTVYGTDGGQSSNSAFAKVAAINEAGISGLTATATNEQALTFASTGGAASAGDDYSLTINGKAIYTAETAALTGSTVAAAINQETDETGVTATFSGSTLTLTSADGGNIEISETAAAAEGITSSVTGNDGGTDAFTTAGAIATVLGGQITLSSKDAITVSGTQEAAIGFTNDQAVAVDSTTISSSSVTTVSNSNSTINRVDAALKTVSDLRSTFGSVQNRFESTITNLQTVSENLSASRSRILDADFAAETANLTKAQILQQAGTAILAQANALPQAALSLLQ